MEIFCKRHPTVKDTTKGLLFIEGHDDLFCYTLEDAIREREGTPVEQWKIQGKTAIPGGRYRVTFEHSPKFGPETLTLNGVKGYTTIRVHAGNDDAVTEGCPLVGFGWIDDPNGDGGNIAGGTSKPALAQLKEIIRAAMERGEQVWWNAINPGR